MGADIRVASVKVSGRKNEYGEWTVRARDCRGKVVATYYTDDKDDAVATAAAMLPVEVQVAEYRDAGLDGRMFRIDHDGCRTFRYRLSPRPGAKGNSTAWDFTPEQVVGQLRSMGYDAAGIRRVLA